MPRDNLAYDFSRFEQTAARKVEKPKKKKAEIRVVETKPAKKTGAAKILAAVTAFVLVTCAVIYNQVVLTELGDQTNKLQNEINIIQSENIRKETELDSKMSLKNIEEYATNELNYVKLDQSRVEYVSLSDDNKIEIVQDRSGVVGHVKDFIAGIVEYFK